jgi:hypothetical protein
LKTFELDVFGLVENVIRGNKIYSSYFGMGFIIRINNQPENGKLYSEMCGEIQERTIVYKN